MRWNLSAEATELARFAAFAYRIENEVARALGERLQMPTEWRSAISQVIDAREVAHRCAAGPVADVALRNSLVRVGDEILQAIIATEDDTNVVSRFTEFYNRLRHIRPKLNGDDLINLGVPQGPMVGELLNELLELRIECSISNASEEREHVIRRLSGG